MHQDGPGFGKEPCFDEGILHFWAAPITHPFGRLLARPNEPVSLHPHEAKSPVNIGGFLSFRFLYPARHFLWKSSLLSQTRSCSPTAMATPGRNPRKAGLRDRRSAVPSDCAHHNRRFCMVSQVENRDSLRGLRDADTPPCIFQVERRTLNVEL